MPKKRPIYVTKPCTLSSMTLLLMAARVSYARTVRDPGGSGEILNIRMPHERGRFR